MQYSVRQVLADIVQSMKHDLHFPDFIIQTIQLSNKMKHGTLYLRNHKSNGQGKGKGISWNIEVSVGYGKSCSSVTYRIILIEL